MALCPICRENETSGKCRVCDSPICREKMQKIWHEGALTIPDGYLTTAGFAKKLNISVQAVEKNCRAGKYIGAFQDPQSGRWYIPIDTTKSIPISPAKVRRKKRPLKVTDEEWVQIVERAALTKYSVNDYIIRVALGKPTERSDIK